jgi:hypothetical protein
MEGRIAEGIDGTFGQIDDATSCLLKVCLLIGD